jgi:hypothetical protein
MLFSIGRSSVAGRAVVAPERPDTVRSFCESLVRVNLVVQLDDIKPTGPKNGRSRIAGTLGSVEPSSCMMLLTKAAPGFPVRGKGAARDSVRTRRRLVCVQDSGAFFGNHVDAAEVRRTNNPAAPTSNAAHSGRRAVVTIVGRQQRLRPAEAAAACRSVPPPNECSA